MDPLLCIRSYRLIPEMDPRHLIVSITALVALGQAPPGKWFAKFCEVRPPCPAPPGRRGTQLPSGLKLGSISSLVFFSPRRIPLNPIGLAEL